MESPGQNAQIAYEGWDNLLRALRKAVRELGLKPYRVRIEHLTGKDMVALLVNAIKERR